MTSALVAIDLQRDYLARPGLVPDAATLIANAAAALDHARTRGWPVVHVRTESDGEHGLAHRRDRPEVVAGTPGAAPPPELAERPGETVLV